VIFQGGCRRGAPDDDNMSARRLAMVEGAICPAAPSGQSRSGSTAGSGSQTTKGPTRTNIYLYEANLWEKEEHAEYVNDAMFHFIAGPRTAADGG